MNDNITDNPVVPVVLRAWKPSGEFLALFPTLPADLNGYHCDSYGFCDGSGGADYHGCIKSSRPAKGEEAAELTRELERIGYRLRVVKRATSAMHDARYAEARRLRNLPGLPE